MLTRQEPSQVLDNFKILKKINSDDKINNLIKFKQS
jgi:hypothetical protein